MGTLRQAVISRNPDSVNGWVGHTKEECMAVLAFSFLVFTRAVSPTFSKSAIFDKTQDLVEEILVDLDDIYTCLFQVEPHQSLQSCFSRFIRFIQYMNIEPTQLPPWAVDDESLKLLPSVEKDLLAMIKGEQPFCQARHDVIQTHTHFFCNNLIDVWNRKNTLMWARLKASRKSINQDGKCIGDPNCGTIRHVKACMETDELIKIPMNESPLIYAATHPPTDRSTLDQQVYFENVRCLVEAGANLEAHDLHWENGGAKCTDCTSLGAAVLGGQTKLIQVLVDLKADLNAPQYHAKYEVDCLNPAGGVYKYSPQLVQPLVLGIQTETVHDSIVKVLVELKADLRTELPMKRWDGKEMRYGVNPVMAAKEANRANLVQYLIGNADSTSFPTPAAAPSAPRQAPGYGQHPGHMQGGPGFGPGGQFQQGGFPQQLPQQMMAMGPQLAEPEQIHNSDKPIADLYASGINKMLTSTPYDVDDKAHLPDWPFGNISFRNPDEQRQPPPAAYGMQGMQGGYPQQQMPYDPAVRSVEELREELDARGGDTKGSKEVLIKRLEELDAEDERMADPANWEVADLKKFLEDHDEVPKGMSKENMIDKAREIIENNVEGDDDDIVIGEDEDDDDNDDDDNNYDHDAEAVNALKNLFNFSTKPVPAATGDLRSVTLAAEAVDTDDDMPELCSTESDPEEDMEDGTESTLSDD